MGRPSNASKVMNDKDNIIVDEDKKIKKVVIPELPNLPEPKSEPTNTELKEAIDDVRSSTDSAKKVLIDTIKSLGIEVDESKSLEELSGILSRHTLSISKTLKDKDRDSKDIAYERYAQSTNITSDVLKRLCFDLAIPAFYLEAQKYIQNGHPVTFYIFSDSDAMNIDLSTPASKERAKEYVLSKVRSSRKTHLDTSESIRSCQSRVRKHLEEKAKGFS